MTRKTSTLAMLCFASITCIAHAEPAMIKRAVDLQAQPQSDAATIVPLAENARVNVVGRKGAWSQVRTAEGKTGWVRMMHVTVEAGAGNPGNSASSNPGSGNPLGGLANLLSSGRTDNAATVTTGVRGLSEADLQNAQSNPAEVEKMQKYAVGTKAGAAFAQRSGLRPERLDYLPAPQAAPVHNNELPMGGG